MFNLTMAMDCELVSETNLTNVKTTIILQTQLLYYTRSDILNRKRLLKAVQFLRSINLLKPTTVYILTRH